MIWSALWGVVMGTLCIGFLDAAQQHEKKDSLHTMTITSDRAVARHDKEHKSTALSYHDNVRVVLNDGTTVTTDTLATSLDHSKTGSGMLQKILCTGSVMVTKEQETVRANSAEIDPTLKKCFLRGSVVLTRTPVAMPGKKSFPTVTHSEYAEIDLQNGVVSIVGSPEEPVKTVISLA